MPHFLLAIFIFPLILALPTRFKRDFMLITDGNITDAGCFEDCHKEYKTKFEYTFNESLSDFYDFPFHPIVLDSLSFQLYCTLSSQKTKCFAQKCNDFTADNSFSPSNFICTFKRELFENALKCLAKAEPITFLKCDQECHDDIIRAQNVPSKPQSSNQVFVATELTSYEGELDKLCRFQSCYTKCQKPIVEEMCGEKDAKLAISIIEQYVQWHADDISDWHAITENQDSLPKSCSELVAADRKRADNDPILQLISETSR